MIFKVTSFEYKPKIPCIQLSKYLTDVSGVAIDMLI